MTQQFHSWVYIWKKMKTLIWKGTCTSMATETLLTMAKSWKQPKCPWTEDSIKKIQHTPAHTHRGILLSHKKNKVLSFASLYKHCTYREGDGTPLQYSCLENLMDGGAWWAAVHGVAKSRTWLHWTTSLSLFTFMCWWRQWRPTPVFLSGESQGRGSLVGCRLWGRTESDMTEAT